MIQSIKHSLEKYENIELYFDNDPAGDRAVEIISDALQNVRDCRALYSNFKDLNEYLVKKTEEVQKQYKSAFKR